MTEREFSTSWDAVTKLTSFFLTGFILLFGYYMIVMGVKGYLYFHSAMIIIAIAGCLMPVVLFTAFLYSPRKYLVDDRGLVIVRIGGNLVIPFEIIESIRQTDKEEIFKKTTREGGSGGCFGYYGYFRNPTLGIFHMYATQRSHLVFITRKNQEPVVLSPDELLEFIDAVQEGIENTVEGQNQEANEQPDHQ